MAGHLEAGSPRANCKMILFNRNKGLTLVELMIAVFILAVGIMSTLLFFSQSLIITEVSGDITTASSHAEYVMEEMRSRKTLVDITSTNWEDWAKEQGLYTLPGESLKVSFNDTISDPLFVETRVNWERSSRTNSVVLVTRITK